MIILGLTGSIGMGKSTTAQMLGELGVPVHDSDAAVHRALGAGGVAVDDVARSFPGSLIPGENAIDRKKLGALIFHDAAKRKTLEDILHPQVRQMQQDFLNAHRQQKTPLVALDIPLLYETGAQARVDKVMVVTCPRWVQQRRVLARPGMTPEKFHAILSTQTPDAEKRRRADYVVQTGFGRWLARAQLKKIIKTLLSGTGHDS